MFCAMESLRQRRKRVVGRQVDLAKKCACHHSHISHIESGRVDPSLDIFVKMIDALDTTPARMLEMLKMCSTKESVTAKERRARR